jgi:hypothetical protein
MRIVAINIIYKGTIKMKKIVFILCLIIIAAANIFSQQSESSVSKDSYNDNTLPGASSLSIRFSILTQTGGDDWTLWYESQGSSSTPYDDHLGLNGVRGFSFGIDAAVEYRITNCFALGVAVGYIPTELHCDVHYYVPNKSIQEVERPNVRIPYIPIRLTASYDLFRWERWSIPIGVQCGVGIFQTTDVHFNIGKSRRFYGDGSLLLGAHVGVTHIVTKGLAITSFLQYQKTSFRVEELGTGDLKQTYNFALFALMAGLQYSFGD